MKQMTTRDVSPLEPRSRERREVVRLVPRIQALSLVLEQLRWRLAAVARRSASDDLDAAA